MARDLHCRRACLEVPPALCERICEPNAATVSNGVGSAATARTKAVVGLRI
jgi:hypothetical protein